MSTLAQRMEELADEKENFRKADLARHCGVKPASVADWFTGRTKHLEGANLLKAAAFFDVNARWLAEGKGAKRDQKPTNLAAPFDDNVTHYTPKTKRPLISWIQAGAFNDIDDPYQPGDGEAFIETEHRSSKSSFWLRVSGDSMEPNFPAGTLVLCDPEVAAQIGNYCIAKDIDRQTATFKKLGGDEMQPMLVPLNDKHPTLLVTDKIRIIGRVIEYRNGGKL